MKVRRNDVSVEFGPRLRETLSLKKNTARGGLTQGGVKTKTKDVIGDTDIPVHPTFRELVDELKRRGAKQTDPSPEPEDFCSSSNELSSSSEPIDEYPS